MGIAPGLDSTAHPKAVSARLRLPLTGNSDNLYLGITIRAPKDNTRLVARSAKLLGEAQIERNWHTVYFTIPRGDLTRDRDTFFLDLNVPTFDDPSGRIVGAEFEKLVISDQPIPRR